MLQKWAWSSLNSNAFNISDISAGLLLSQRRHLSVCQMIALNQFLLLGPRLTPKSREWLPPPASRRNRGKSSHQNHFLQIFPDLFDCILYSALSSFTQFTGYQIDGYKFLLEQFSFFTNQLETFSEVCLES